MRANYWTSFLKGFLWSCFDRDCIRFTNPRGFQIASTRTICLVLAGFVFGQEVSAQNLPQSFVYQGRAYQSNGTTPLTDVVNFTLEIYSPDGTCLLYREQQSGVDLAPNNGLFSLQVGSNTGASKRIAGDPGLSMSTILRNGGTALRTAGSHTATSPCPVGYTSSAGERRRLKVTIFNTNTNQQTVLDPMQDLVATPFSIMAESLQGKVPSDFINVSGTTTQTNVDALTANTSALTQ